MFRKRKTWNPRQKTSPPPPPLDHSSEISTTQDSCCTIDHYELSKPISLSILEPFKLQVATGFIESFLFLPYQRTSIEASMKRPPIWIWFWKWLPKFLRTFTQLTGSVCGWDEGIQNHNQWLKEIEKRW